MITRIVFVCVLLATTVPAFAAQAGPPAPHDKAFWQSIINNEYKPPEGANVRELARELNIYLGSPDPQLRDEFAYSILTAWMTRVHALDSATVKDLAHGWLRNIARVDNRTPNAVLLRSFSTLMLSIVAARDNAEPFLSEPEFRELWNAALSYLRAETDLRGHDPHLGWIHATAHTADLLKFLGRSRYVTAEDQATLLGAIGGRLESAPMVFIYGEDERLARAALSIVLRNDFDVAGFSAWPGRLRERMPKGDAPNERELHVAQNIKNFLAKLEVVLRNQPDQAPAVKSANDAVLAAVKNTF